MSRRFASVSNTSITILSNALNVNFFLGILLGAVGEERVRIVAKLEPEEGSKLRTLSEVFRVLAAGSLVFLWISNFVNNEEYTGTGSGFDLWFCGGSTAVSAFLLFCSSTYLLRLSSLS